MPKLSALAVLPSASARLGRDFLAFWAGQTLSNLGSSFTIFALPLLVYKLTGSAVNLALAGAASFLPYLLFGMAIGAWVDRVDRKRLMIAVDIRRALVMVTIPLLAALDQLAIWWIYVVIFVATTLTIAFDAGEFAAIAHLVAPEDLVLANGRIQASYSAASVVGPLLAGALLAIVALPALPLFDALTFLLPARPLRALRRSFNTTADEQPEPASAATSIRQDIIEGLKYVLGHPVLRQISLMMVLTNFVGATISGQLVLFAQQRLHATNSQVALLFAAEGAGVVVLALLADSLRKRFGFSAVALGALVMYGLMTVAVAATPWFWLAMPIWALAWGSAILFNINANSLRQSIAPREMLGRVMTVASALGWSAVPIWLLIGGLLIQATGRVALIYAGIGTIIIVIGVVFSFTAVGHADRYILPPAPAAETQGAGNVSEAGA